MINFSDVGVAGLLRTTGGANILDSEFGYSTDKAYQMLTALGGEGRSFYLTKILPIDFPFPFAYMLCYVGWIALLIKHSTTKKLCKYLLLAPVLAMLFDWIENVGIIAMLKHYPNLPTWAVTTASTAGMLKTIFTVSSMAIILTLLIVFLIKKMRKS